MTILKILLSICYRLGIILSILVLENLFSEQSSEIMCINEIGISWAPLCESPCSSCIGMNQLTEWADVCLPIALFCRAEDRAIAST
jgi:hypothetical protein